MSAAGLDPQSRANLWDHIRALREQHGVTVVLTTHYLDDVFLTLTGRSLREAPND